VDAAIAAIEDLRGREVRVLDLRGLCEATDYFVIASGTSDAHVRGLADSVVEKLHRRGARAHHVEGLPGGRWVLLFRGLCGPPFPSGDPQLLSAGAALE
jgi:ribosome-associated protein